MQLFQRNARFGCLLFGNLLVFDHRSQQRDQFKIFARTDLQENIGSFDALGFANIDQDHRPIFTTFGQKFALRHQRVLGEVARMALGRVASPVDDEIGSVLDFAQRACDFATQLGGDFGGTVSQRCVAIEQTT